AIEALESVPLLARALESAGVGAPVTRALGRLISGELPLDDWVALVRATVPPPALPRRRPHPDSRIRRALVLLAARSRCSYCHRRYERRISIVYAVNTMAPQVRK